MVQKISKTDKRIAKNFKKLRAKSGISSRKLGEMLGVSGTQIIMYETANNRIPSSTLYDAAQIFNVEVQTFFD